MTEFMERRNAIQKWHTEMSSRASAVVGGACADCGALIPDRDGVIHHTSYPDDSYTAPVEELMKRGVCVWLCKHPCHLKRHWAWTAEESDDIHSMCLCSYCSTFLARNGFWRAKKLSINGCICRRCAQRIVSNRLTMQYRENIVKMESVFLPSLIVPASRTSIVRMSMGVGLPGWKSYHGAALFSDWLRSGKLIRIDRLYCCAENIPERGTIVPPPEVVSAKRTVRRRTPRMIRVAEDEEKLHRDLLPTIKKPTTTVEVYLAGKSLDLHRWDEYQARAAVMRWVENGSLTIVSPRRGSAAATYQYRRGGDQ